MLKSINIPATVTSLGSRFIANCTELTQIYLNWTTSGKIITYNHNWFSASINANLKFKVPSGKTSLYTNKGYPSDKVVAQ